MSHQVFRSIDSGSVKGFAKNVAEAEAQVSRPNLLTYLNRTPIFEWCMVRCGCKNGHQKDM